MEKSASVFWLQKGNADPALQVNLIAQWQPTATGNSPATIWVAHCLVDFSAHSISQSSSDGIFLSG